MSDSDPPGTPAPEEPEAPAGKTAAGGETAAPSSDTLDVTADATPEAAPEATPELLRERWLRAEADLQNFRRRARRDVEEVRRSVEEAALHEVLSFLDDLERALSAAADADVAPAWVEGVRLVAGRMTEYLARQGVEAMDPVGDPFDPQFHEALLEIDAPEGATPGHVVSVVRSGYRRHGRALRAARVVVARAPGGAD